MNLQEFHETDSKEEPSSTTVSFQETSTTVSKSVNADDILTELRNLNLSTSPAPHEQLLKVSSICLLKGLKSMSSMNGKKCRIIGPLNETEQRYPVFVYGTKDIALIKPCNLMRATVDHFDCDQSTNSSESVRRMQIHEVLQLSNGNVRDNMASSFAGKVMKSNFNQLNTNLMDDFKRVLEGNCIYIPLMNPFHSNLCNI